MRASIKCLIFNDLPSYLSAIQVRPFLLLPGVTPVPDKDIFIVPSSRSLLTIVRVAFFRPAVVGLKATVMSLFAPGAMSAVLADNEKFVVSSIVIEVSTSALVPGALAILIVCKGDDVVTSIIPKL